MIKVTASYSGRQAEFWLPCSEAEMHKCFEQLQASEEHSTSLFVQTVIRPIQLTFLEDIKRFLALYFDAFMNGEQMPDNDGEQFYDLEFEE